ncbi:MAG: nicotinate-nucleotide adenylyltransferase [Betaproteobacteria bacterium]
MSVRAHRIGLLGGAFDPPHQAHVALARAALDQLELDELRIIPTGQAWHKSRSLTPGAHRLAMARLAFAGLPGVLVDDSEIARGGPTYTIDTLQALHLEQPQAELYLVIGGDQWAAFTTWRRWREVAQRAHVCVVDRPDLAQGGPDDVPVRHLRLSPMAISATALREHLARGLPVAALSPQLPEAVARYISEHHLYVPG